MPDGKAKIEPRWDIEAKRKPPVPYPSIGWAPGKKPAYLFSVMSTLLDALPGRGAARARVLRRLLRGLSHRSRTHSVAPQAEIDQHWRTNKDGGIGRDENAPD